MRYFVGPLRPVRYDINCLIPPMTLPDLQEGAEIGIDLAAFRGMAVVTRIEPEGENRRLILNPLWNYDDFNWIADTIEPSAM